MTADALDAIAAAVAPLSIGEVAARFDRSVDTVRRWDLPPPDLVRGGVHLWWPWTVERVTPPAMGRPATTPPHDADAAVAAVLRLHAPTGDVPAGGDVVVCVSPDHGDIGRDGCPGVAWPCPTVRAIRDAR